MISKVTFCFNKTIHFKVNNQQLPNSKKTLFLIFIIGISPQFKHALFANLIPFYLPNYRYVRHTFDNFEFLIFFLIFQLTILVDESKS